MGLYTDRDEQDRFTIMAAARDVLRTEHPEGYVTTPGKFEGECLYSLYYWDVGMNGGEDESLDDNGRHVAVFFVDATERDVWGLAPDTFAVVLWERDDGFVISDEWTEAQYEQAVKDCEGSDGETDDESEES